MIDPHDGMSETLLVVNCLKGCAGLKSRDISIVIDKLSTNPRNIQLLTKPVIVDNFDVR